MPIPELMGQVMYLSLAVLLGLAVHRLTRLDVTLACLAAGVLAGLGVDWLAFDTGVRATNLQSLLFYVILPVLIFEAAWHINPATLKRWLAPILLLATLGMFASTLVAAALMYVGIGHPQGFPFIAAVLAAAIVAATDPVGVVSALRRRDAPEDLTLLVEGESLFNDATALVLVAAVLAFATSGGGATEGSFLWAFFLTFTGGLVLGALMGLVAAIGVLLLGSSAASNILLLVTAFASFYIAEHLVHVSGIMTLVAAAITSRALLKEQEQTFLAGVVDTWEWLGLLFNSLVFVLMGLVITFAMFTEQWLAMLVAIPAALAGRACAVLLTGFLVRGRARPVPWGWQVVLVWGGLRGAIAVVLVLSLPTSLPYWWTVQSMVFGVVLFSLLVQGTTMGPVIARYGQSTRA